MKTNVISRILDVQEFISRYDFKNKYNELQAERLRLCHDIQQQSSNEINYKLFHDVEVDLNTVQNILSDIDYINEISDILDDSLSSTEIDQILKSVEDIKQHIFNYLYNIYHNNNMECDGAIISLNAGSGGVEAEDWTGMILRMYLMWCKKRNISHDIISTMYSADAPNGIKSCELLLNNKMAYELLNKETGVHRLVRMSPFSKSKSRHTSFCAVRVIPNQKDAINIVINEAQDVRIDVMRGHGAGVVSIGIKPILRYV